MSVEQASLNLEPLGEVAVETIDGVEGMNRLPRFDVTILTDDANLDLEAVLGTPAMLTLGDDEGARRSIPLVVGEIAYAGLVGRRHRFEVALTSPLGRLTHRRGYRTFLDLSAKQIVDEILNDADLGGDVVQWRLTEQLYTRAQCVQYDETEWDFIARLLADEGIAFWHESDGEQPVLVLGDAPASHDPLGGEAFGFDDGSGLRKTTSAFFELERAFTQVPTGCHLREYDVRQPNVLLEGTAGEGFLEQYEYPAWVVAADAAARRAAVRLEQHQRHADVVKGATLSVRMIPGRVVAFDNLPDSYLDGEYLVTEIRHRLDQREGPDSQPYAARCTFVPHGERTYRPAAPTDPPRVDAIESAVVTGPAGEEIHVDDLGRVKLLTRWDTSGKSDDTTSAWARTTQMNMDGSMLLPRVGFPMAVAYRDGRPDMPVALGKLYNGTHRTPYPLPEKKATASLMSITSPGGGSVNEIKMSDDDGAQSFGVQASGDQGITVGGDATIDVAVDETVDIKGSFSEHIMESEVSTIGGNQTITTKATHATKVGARIATIGGNEEIGATKNCAIKCAGAYTESVAGVHFTRCNVASDTCKASFVQGVGGAMVVAAGCGTSEMVLGARTETTGGPRLVAAGMFEDHTYGAKAITCGANSLTAAGAIEHKVKGAAAILAGATVLDASSTVEIVSDGAVNVVAAALSVSGGSSYSIAGAHSTSADINLDNATANYKLTKAKG